MPKDEELALAAAVNGGFVVERVRATPGESNWARQAREDLQGSHSLSASPLARWAPEPVESAVREEDDGRGNGAADVVIPEAVLQARPVHRLPEDAVCRSPIAGVVIAVLAAAGDRVSSGRPVLVIEAMKMQNDVAPEVDGVLKIVHVAPGDAVRAGQVLFELV